MKNSREKLKKLIFINFVYNTYKTQAVYSGSNSTETNTAPIEKQDFEDYNGMLSLFRKSDFLGCVK